MLFLHLMKLKNIISLLLLTVYSIVLAHNFIPHHHHYELASNSETTCQIEKEQNQCCNDFSVQDNEHDSHSHNSCNFNEKIILTKSDNLSPLYFPAKIIGIVFSKPVKISFADLYIPIQLSDRHPHHIQLRGPPVIA
ncbi:hypothetical protein SAMN05444280_105181 [Tangfeifania diversioriginum]|uniref:Uncharacterized protein n=2 Tax=Tangfeifania diversioriginum TaxID=1168035 RepID=A0A1M6DUA0_9BACT|nr:hypothetical protein SAMN05444280_105181 [Tangfeifania diversioriginum]